MKKPRVARRPKRPPAPPRDPSVPSMMDELFAELDREALAIAEAAQEPSRGEAND